MSNTIDMKKKILFTAFLIICSFLLIMCLVCLYNQKNKTDFVQGRFENFYKNNVYEYDKKINYKDLDILKEFSTKDDSIENEKARKIIWHYLYSKYSLNKTGEEDAETFKPEGTMGFEYDLDDDGQNEIIGSIMTCAFWGTDSGVLFILKKEGDFYVSVNSISVPSDFSTINILKPKTNGWHDIAISTKRNSTFETDYYKSKNL